MNIEALRPEFEKWAVKHGGGITRCKRGTYFSEFTSTAWTAYIEGHTQGRQSGMMEAQDIAARFSVKPDRSLHPDVQWEQMPETVQATAHTTAQLIAIDIETARDAKSL